jgi:hypothetical protein
METNNRPVIAARVCANTFGDILEMTATCVANDLFWSKCTHIVYDALRMKYLEDCSVTVQSPIYLPLIVKIGETWNISIVWSLPRYDDAEHVVHALSRAHNNDKFWDTLLTSVLHYGIKILELDMEVLWTALAYSTQDFTLRIEDLMNAGCRIWVRRATLINPIHPDKMPTFKNLIAPVLDKIVINSNQLHNVKMLNTSKGTYRCLEIGYESSVANTMLIYRDMLQWFTWDDQYLLDIDTSGIEYVHKDTDLKAVAKYRHVSLKEIRRRLRFGCEWYQEHFDPNLCGCQLEFPSTKSVISYDNAQVRHKKILLARDQMSGVIVGFLENDVIGDESLLHECHTILY